MKITFAAIATLFLGASMVSAALEPRVTMAPQHNKRGKFSDGLDLSAILADPSSYLAAASKAFKNPKYASEFAKATANPKFEKSLSKELVSQFGSKTASIALQQYTAIAHNKKKAAAAAATSSTESSNVQEGVAATFPSTTAKATSSSANWEAQVTSAVAGDILGSTSGSSSTFLSVTLLGTAISLGAAVVLAAL